MQRTKEINIGGKRITVRELLVRDVWELIQQDVALDLHEDDGARMDGDGLKQRIDNLLSKCTGLTIDDLLDYYPSEVVDLWEAVMEVNQAFFDLPRKMGLNRTMEKLQEALVIDFNNRFFGSWSEDTAASSGNTDTRFS